MSNYKLRIVSYYNKYVCKFKKNCYYKIMNLK